MQLCIKLIMEFLYWADAIFFNLGQDFLNVSIFSQDSFKKTGHTIWLKTPRRRESKHSWV